MTIDQMHKEVKGYCFRTPYCAECRLITPDAVCGWGPANDKSTEDCYWLLVNEGLISKPEQPEINFVKAEHNDEVEPTNNAAKHMELCKYLNNLYATKNKKYGDSFSITVQKYGMIAALTRLSDKWQRFETLILTKDSGTPDESIRDTLLDMANYCIMTVMELDQKEV